MPLEPKDSVASPTPAQVPSPSAQPTPVATPEPVGGVPAAPPAASDKAPAPSTPVETTDSSKGVSPIPPGIVPLGEGDALDRLTSPTEKPKENPPVTATPPKPAAEPLVDAENKAAPPESEDAPFKDADDAELSGYHSRTRHRIKQYQQEVTRLRPAAKFGFDLAEAASNSGVKLESVVAWQELGFGLRAKDPEAIEALANIVGTYGVKVGADAPVDLTALETAVGEVFQSMDLSEAGKAKLQAALAGLKVSKAPAQPRQQAQPQAQPQRQQAAPQRQQAHPLQETANWIGDQEAQLEAQIGKARFAALRPAIYVEAKRREAGLDLRLLNDPVDMRVRWASCKEHVLARASQAAAAPRALPTVQPLLAANHSATPIQAPKKGTPEYDDHILTHGLST